MVRPMQQSGSGQHEEVLDEVMNICNLWTSTTSAVPWMDPGVEIIRAEAISILKFLSVMSSPSEAKISYPISRIL